MKPRTKSKTVESCGFYLNLLRNLVFGFKNIRVHYIGDVFVGIYYLLNFLHKYETKMCYTAEWLLVKKCFVETHKIYFVQMRTLQSTAVCMGVL